MDRTCWNWPHVLPGLPCGWLWKKNFEKVANFCCITCAKKSEKGIDHLLILTVITVGRCWHCSHIWLGIKACQHKPFWIIFIFGSTPKHTRRKFKWGNLVLPTSSRSSKSGNKCRTNPMRFGSGCADYRSLQVLLNLQGLSAGRAIQKVQLPEPFVQIAETLDNVGWGKHCLCEFFVPIVQNTPLLRLCTSFADSLGSDCREQQSSSFASRCVEGHTSARVDSTRVLDGSCVEPFEAFHFLPSQSGTAVAIVKFKFQQQIQTRLDDRCLPQRREKGKLQKQFRPSIKLMCILKCNPHGRKFLLQRDETTPISLQWTSGSRRLLHSISSRLWKKGQHSETLILKFSFIIRRKSFSLCFLWIACSLRSFVLDFLCAG